MSSPGSATVGSRKRGNSRTGWSGIPRVYAPRHAVTSSLARSQQQVVEDRGRQAWLQYLAVQPLQQEVSTVGVAAPQHRHFVRIGGCLERTVEPPEPARE